jgi:catechol 2,3-dioxygenase-like lactoylglutathione lyase family enzyme
VSPAASSDVVVEAAGAECRRRRLVPSGPSHGADGTSLRALDPGDIPAIYRGAMTDKPLLNAFGIVVTDMARSLAFYRQLGLDIPADADGQPHVDVAIGAGIRLMFDTVEVVRSFDASWQPPSGGNRMGLAFECASPAMVDEVYERLVAAGNESHLAPWDAPWGQRYAMVYDPDGNGVDLYANR